MHDMISIRIIQISLASSGFLSFLSSSILLLMNAHTDFAVVLTFSPTFFASSFNSPLVTLWCTLSYAFIPSFLLYLPAHDSLSFVTFRI